MNSFQTQQMTTSLPGGETVGSLRSPWRRARRRWVPVGSGWGTPSTAGRIGSPSQCGDWFLWRWTGPPTKERRTFTSTTPLLAGGEFQSSLLIHTLKREKIIRWWAFDKTGKPFLLVRKMLVGSMAALMGSPSHLSITASDGMSAPISIASGIQRKEGMLSVAHTNIMICYCTCFARRLLLRSVLSHQDRSSCCNHKVI